MDYVTLGRTGLSVSVAGVGCGGGSRLGQSYGASIEDSVAVIHEAMNLGINYFDTAQSYGTEEILGRAIAGVRDEVIVSTKVDVRWHGASLYDAKKFREGVEDSLKSLSTDFIDVLHFHGPDNADYAHCVNELVPVLVELRDQGHVRYIAISESFRDDPGHELLHDYALDDDCWDVAMIGFNILNPTARSRVLSRTIEQGVGIEVMYAVRNAFSRPEALRRSIEEAVAHGAFGVDELDRDDPLGFLIHDGGASTLMDAAYRFARHEPGCNVILTGTGNIEHLRTNVQSITAPPLPEQDLARLRQLFGDADYLTGN